MTKTMAEVLAEHWSASTHSDHEPPVDKCDGCGEVLREWGDDSDMPAQLAAHQAAALSAAGFGPVREARAKGNCAICGQTHGHPDQNYQCLAPRGHDKPEASNDDQ